MILSFPGGCGGNWVVKIILNSPIKSGTVNFHYSNNQSLNLIKLVHEIDITKFDYLYSGSSYFNFYINVLLKHFIHETDLFSTPYEDSFLTCVNTARYICSFDRIKNCIFLNFDELENSPELFLENINYLQRKLNVPLTNIDNFTIHRDTFISTCVNPLGVYENFDDMFWICFVLGQLMNHGCVPNDFLIFKESNQDKCKKFARENYHLCNLNNVKLLNTNVRLPKVFNK